MARKKRKAAKSPAAVAGRELSPRPESSGRDAWLLPGAGALVLVLAWLALLGGFADETLDWRWIFHLDPMRLVLMFNDWRGGEFSLDGWRMGSLGLVLPDYVLTWGPLLAGLDFRAVLYLFPLLHGALAAAGWMVLCDFLFGKSPLRRAAALLAGALPLLLAAWRGGDWFLILFSPQTHSGAWLLMPWLLWALSRALAGDGGGKKNNPPAWGWLAALAVLTAANAADGAALPWFVAPAVFSVLCLVWRGDVAPGAAARAAAAVVAGYYLGREITWMLNPIPESHLSGRLKLDSAAMLQALRALGDWAAFMAGRNPLESAAWAAFAGVAAWRMLAVFAPGARRRLPPFMALPPGRAHALLALFVPAAAAASVASMIISGYFNFGEAYVEGVIDPSWAHRLLMPMMFFPLFSGWLLLPWGGGGAGVFRLRAAAAPLAAALAVGLFSAPKALSIRTAALDPLATPFQQCFAENARRLGWTGGIATWMFGQGQTVHPLAGVERMMQATVYRAKAGASGGALPAVPHPAAGGRSLLVADNTVANGHENSGEFQFAVANVFRGTLFIVPPKAGEAGCALTDASPACRAKHFDGRGLLDEAVFRGAFGEPKEVIDCAGVGLLHYDPPLRFDFSGRDSHFAPVAVW